MFVAPVREKNPGFSLLEMSIVIMIAGVVLAAAAQAYGVYSQNQRVKQMYEKIAVVDQSILVFNTRTGRYPCPSNPALPPSDPNYGREDCSLFTAPEGTCDGGLCKVFGARDTDDPDNTLDPILIGGVPFASIRELTEDEECYSTVTGAKVSCADANAFKKNVVSISSTSLDTVVDPWGYQMRYAVTQSQAEMRHQLQRGAIGVKTEAGIDLVEPPGSANYVLIFHGKNHVGAYSKDGIQTVPCAPGTAESQNCTIDPEFVNGLLAQASGAGYFDDVVLHRSYTISQIWKENDLYPGYIYSTNPGNVGVGTDTPEEKLDIIGTLSASAIKAERICDKAGVAGCWSPELFIARVCPDGQALRAIKNGDFECDIPPASPKFIGGMTCNYPSYVQGFNASGAFCGCCED